MSRFFAAGGSDSEPEEDQDDNRQVSDEDADQAPALKGARLGFESSSEEDEKRVVRTEKEKRWDMLQGSIRKMKNAQKINDWVQIVEHFDTLNKQLQAAKNVVAKEGIPKFYFKAVLELEDFATESFKAMKDEKAEKGGKKFNAPNAKALSTMKQKLKKNRAQYETEFKKYEDSLAAGAAPAEDVAEAANDDEEDEDEDAPKRKKPAARRISQAEDDDDIDFDDAEDQDSESSDSDIELNVNTITRDFWVKKDKDDDAFGDEEEDKEEAAARKERRRKEREEAKKAKLEEEAKRAKEKGMAKDAEYTAEMIVKKLGELYNKFGRRGTDKVGMIEDLRFLATKAKDPAAFLKVSTALAAALFDSSLGAGDFMPIPLWKHCADTVNDIVETLANNLNIRLTEDDKVDESLSDDVDPEDEQIPDAPEASEVNQSESTAKSAAPADGEDDKSQLIQGNLFPFINRLVGEYRKSLQFTDPHTAEYIVRLKDERNLVKLIEKAQKYYHTIGKLQLEVGVSLLRLDFEYYLYRPELDVQTQQLQQLAAKNIDPTSVSKLPPYTVSDDNNVVVQLCRFLYKHGDSKTRTRSLLFHIYHLAIHNRFPEARDLTLMSRVQDTIGNADIRTRILFNRALAQLGAAAFRANDTRQALACLAELFQSNRHKELLGQGTSQQRWVERDQEKERLERLRQLPYHMHMNPDMIEGVHLTSAMLHEVPNMAQYGAGNKRRQMSKTFRRLYDYHTKQAFNGPPENTRENVMAATKAMQRGDWQRCESHIFKLRAWDFVPNAAYIKSFLSQRIREETLRTYLLTNGAHYATISQASLCSMFNLPERTVYKLTSAMMNNEQLLASWDQPSKVLALYAADPTRLERAALKFTDKAASIIEPYDRMFQDRFDQKRPGGWYRDNRGGGGGGGGGGGNRQNFERRPWTDRNNNNDNREAVPAV